MNPVNSINPMGEQDRSQLHELLEISRENNAMLHKLVRAERWASLWKLLYWTILVGAVIAGYYSLQPYIKPLMEAYAKISSVIK